MSEYDETKPLRELVAMKQALAGMQDDFVDVNGLPLDIGTPVQYILEREDWEAETSPWNPERWGVVTGVTQWENREGEMERHVQVTTVYVLPPDQSGDWPREQWHTQPESLRVIQ